MIVPVDRNNLFDAARVHAAAWQQSHSFCKPDFVRAHTPERQAEYLRGKLLAGSRIWMLTDGEPRGIVSVTGSLIADLYVHPDGQGRGYGTALLFFAIRRCEGVPELWVLENNLRAADWYRRVGFRETGNRHVITDGLDEIEFSLAPCIPAAQA